jgi:hypothetical protein
MPLASLPTGTRSQDPVDPWVTAALLGLSRDELAAMSRVHPHALRLTPNATRVQDTVRLLSEVHLALIEAGHAQGDIAFFFRNRPLAEFGYRTLFEQFVVGEGQAVANYLITRASGFVG